MATNFGIPGKIFAFHERLRAGTDALRPPRDATSPFWASELGACGRKITFSMSGYPSEGISGKTARIFRMGDIVEENVVAELRQAGYTVVVCEKGCDQDCDHDQQKRIRIKYPFVYGKIDGLITGMADGKETTRLLELKSMNTRGFALLRVQGLLATQPSYYAQIQAYLFGLDLAEATVVVEDKNTQDLYEETIEFDAFYTADLFVRLQIVRRFAEAGKLAPPEYPKSSFQCRYCPYRDNCSGLPEPERPPLPTRARGGVRKAAA